MAQYLFTVKDAFGHVIMANGWGDYVEADSLAEARATAEAIFLAPLPLADPVDSLEGSFLSRVQAKQQAAIRDGYSILCKRRR